MIPEERRLWASIGGYTRALNWHLREIETAPLERIAWHRKRVVETRENILKAWREIDYLRKKEIPPPPPPPPPIDHEFIDIDEETGLFIWYDLVREKYFKTRPEDPVMPAHERFYYNTISLTVNYAFQTGGGGKSGTGKLAAEIKITVRVEKTRSRTIDSMLYWMNKSYKAFVADYFGWDFGIERNREKGEKIASGVFTVEDYVPDELAETAPEPIKVGVYIRCSQKAPDLVPQYRYARADVFGEWSRFVGETETKYDWRKFDLKEWLDKLGAWSDIEEH